jgi:hypothetical protein
VRTRFGRLAPIFGTPDRTAVSEFQRRGRPEVTADGGVAATVGPKSRLADSHFDRLAVPIGRVSKVST